MTNQPNDTPATKKRGRPRGSHDKTPRTVPNPLPAFAKLAGRTEHVRINGNISEAAYNRLTQERGDTMPEKLSRCLERLARFEKHLDAVEMAETGDDFCL